MGSDQIIVMQQPPPTLANLPFEILSQILMHLVPKDGTFRIKTLRKPLPNFQPKGDRVLGLEVVYYSWTTKRWIVWASGGANVCPELLPLLLIHPAIYPIVLERFYSTNMLWFPDLYTLRRYSKNFSLRAKHAIRTLAIDACGREYARRTCIDGLNTWEYGAEIGIANALLQFPGLTDLRLGGVGPGLYERVEWSDRWTTWPSLPGPNNTMVPNTLPPGPVAVLGGDENDVWPVDCIALVASIVGIREDATRGDNSGRTIRAAKRRGKRQNSVGPLQDGSIFCHKQNHDQYHRRAGRLRRVGTRIVKRGESINIDPEMEGELTDITATIDQARSEAKRKAEYERRRVAGEYR